MTTSVTNNMIVKVAATVAGLAMVASMAFAFVPAAKAETTAQLQAQISSLLATIQSLQAQLNTVQGNSGSTSTVSKSSCAFTMDLTIGSKGSDVTCLQNYLTKGGYFTYAGGSTGYFGPVTQKAVAAWQAANNVAPAVGYFGSISRAEYTTLTASTGTSTGTGTGTVTVATGNGLKVALAATSPNGTALVSGQGIANLAEFTFTNPTSSAIAVNSLSFKRIGISNDSTMTNVYLYNGVNRVTDSAGVSNSQFSFNNTAGIFKVPAGGSYTVAVRSDIAGGTPTTSTAGQQLGVELTAIGSNGTLDSSVSLPIVGGMQGISSATLAGVNFVNTTATPLSATTINAQNNYPVWQDNISVTNNPVKLSSMTFTNLGSANSSSIINLRLFVDGTQVGSAVPTMSANRTVTFNLSANPLTLSTRTHVMKVLANITNAAASRSIIFSVQRSSDGMFVDSQLGQPVTPTIGSTAPFSAVSTGKITIQSAFGAGVSVSRDPASPNQSVAVGASNVKFASFDMLASGENVKVSNLTVKTSNLNGLNNGTIMVNGVQVGSTQDISNTGVIFQLGSSLILTAGKTVTVDIYADAQKADGTDLASGTNVTVSLTAGSLNGQGQSSLTSTSVPSSVTSGNPITVSNSTLTATKYTGYGNQTVISGANNAKLGAFTLSTGATEGVTVNTIVITLPNTVAAASTTSLYLKDAATGTVLGTVKTNPSVNNSFSVSLNIPASSAKTINVYGNVLSGAGIGSFTPDVGIGTQGTGDATGNVTPVGSSVSLQQVTIGKGSLSVTRGAGDPVSNNIIAGATLIPVGEFNFAALNSAYTVQNLAITVPNAPANSVTNVSIKYKNADGTVLSSTQPLTITTGLNKTAVFSNLAMYVPKNDSANLDVFVGTPSIANGATSGAAINVALDDNSSLNGLFTAVNSAGSSLHAFNNNIIAITSNGTFYVRKSIPTFAMLPTGVTVPVTGTPVYKFSITADPANPVEWSKLTFNVATSSTAASSITGFYLVNDAAPSINLLDANVNAVGATGSQTVIVNLGSNSTNAQYQQIAKGTTKNYSLYATVAGFTTGSTITISLASDGSHVANSTAIGSSAVSGNTVWSDRSANSHSVTTNDWTNGYLLKNFTSNAVSYSK